jgi:hypothetical protein
MLWGQYVWPQVGRSLTHTDLSLHSLIESKRAYVKVKVSNGYYSRPTCMYAVVLPVRQGYCWFLLCFWFFR